MGEDVKIVDEARNRIHALENENEALKKRILEYEKHLDSDTIDKINRNLKR